LTYWRGGDNPNPIPRWGTRIPIPDADLKKQQKSLLKKYPSGKTVKIFSQWAGFSKQMAQQRFIYDIYEIIDQELKNLDEEEERLDNEAMKLYNVKRGLWEYRSTLSI
jgi:hypothetical protein